VHPWLKRLRHDLVKRAVWTARDLRETGAAPTAADLRALRSGLRELVDPEGQAIDARSLWALLRADAPPEALADPEVQAAADAFSAALEAADLAVASLEGQPARAPEALETVLKLEPAFEGLARSMNRGVRE